MGLSDHVEKPAEKADLPTQDAIELKFLRWFYQNCDFGPAHEDVIMIMMENYHAADPTNIIPPNYIEEYIGEDDSIR